MAKKPAPEAKAAPKAAPVSTEEKLPFGVAELADALGIEPTSVRVKLRNAEIAKSGRSYGWKNQKEFDAVVKQLKSEKAPAKAEPAAAPAKAPKGKAKA